MLSLRHATVADIPLIQDLTNRIWPQTYGTILTTEQIAYMLEMMYSSESLREQMTELKHEFLICDDDDEAVGFASFSMVEPSIWKLHKIYVLLNKHGRGIGRFMIDHILNEVRLRGATALDLNVNRHNPATHFYKKLGFEIIREEDIDIGNGYWMNDFVMRHTL